MKKATAIFLLFVTLYNIGGYLLMFQYFIYRSDKTAEQQIAKNLYKTSDLVEIKIPVHLTGIDNWGRYQSVSGTVQLAQNSYNYVQMKMTTDTIYVLCVPNYKTTRLIKDNVICARDVSEAPFNAKKQSTPVKSVNMVSHVVTERLLIESPQSEIVLLTMRPVNAKPVAGVLKVAGQPPEALLS